MIVSPPRLIAAIPVVAASKIPLSSSAHALVANVLPQPAGPASSVKVGTGAGQSVAPAG